MSLKTIVLVGNPNVGKSVLFSQLTGARVVISNYPGTTVEFTRGQLRVGQQTWEVLDAPGTYSLEPTCRAEEVTTDLVDSADVVVNVVDATNLERNLYLTSQLLERGVPLVVALNLIDEAAQKGVVLDIPRLQELLGVPVIPTVAISGKGLPELVAALPEARRGKGEALSPDERWIWIGSIVEKVQRVTRRRKTWLEVLELASIRPLTGIPIAVVGLYLAFKVIIGCGKWLEHLLESLFFEPVYLPLLYSLSRSLGGVGFWHDLLIGNLNGGADLPRRIDGPVEHRCFRGLRSSAALPGHVLLRPGIFRGLWLPAPPGRDDRPDDAPSRLARVCRDPVASGVWLQCPRGACRPQS